MGRGNGGKINRIGRNELYRWRKGNWIKRICRNNNDVNKSWKKGKYRNVVGDGNRDVKLDNVKKDIKNRIEWNWKKKKKGLRNFVNGNSRRRDC